MAALTYRERLQELRRELADLSRAFKGEEGAGSMFLDIAAGAVKDALGAVKDALGELPRAALGRLMPGAPGSLKAGLEPARGAAPAASEGGRGLRPSEPAGTPVGPAVSEREAPKAAAVPGKRRVNPCSRCGQPGHRMDNKTFHPPDGAAAQPAETPASDDEDPEPDAAADLPPYRQAASSGFGPSSEAAKQERPRALGRYGWGSVVGKAKGFSFLVFRDGKRLRSSVQPTREAAAAALAVFNETGVMPPPARRGPAPGSKRAARPPAPMLANEEVPPREIIKENGDDDGRRAQGARGETIEESAGAPLVRARRAPPRCRRCHQPGHRSDTCPVEDDDRRAARVQDIAAAAQRLGLAPPPEPRVLPVKHEGSVCQKAQVARLAAWDRDDPEQDLTDLDLGVAEPAAAAPSGDGRRETDECSACGKMGHWRNGCPTLGNDRSPIAPSGPMLIEPPRPISLIEGQSDPTPIQARLRAKLRVVNGRIRAKTVSQNGPAGILHRDERATAEDDELLDPSAYDRPATRGDCEAGEHAARPCPFVSCQHHLALDVNGSTGALKLNFPHLEVWEMAETCSLDVADRGGITLEEVGAILNLTRERIRQVEVTGLEKIRKHSGDDLEGAPERFSSPLGEAID